MEECKPDANIKTRPDGDELVDAGERLLRRLCGPGGEFENDRHAARDCVQRVLLRVLGKRPDDVNSYMAKAVQNDVIDQRRLMERRPTLVPLDSEEGVAFYEPDTLLPPDEQFILEDVIRLCCDCLPQGLEQEVLTLRAQGNEYEEIGRRIGRSASVVGNILQRCRERLRKTRVDQRIKELFTC